MNSSPDETRGPFWIRFAPSAIHGTGGFAVVDIPAGVRVIEYVGLRIDKAESLRQCMAGNPFIFYGSPDFDLNGDVPENPARYLNHSCDPNAEAELIDGRIWIVTRRLVKAGDEITFDYGYDLNDFREHPCCCASPRCVGYMVAEVFRDRMPPPLEGR